MKIKKLKLEGFKKFTGHEFNFNPGLNCIWGDNETGKSSFLEVFSAVFFGAKLEDIQSWQHGGICLAELNYITNDSQEFQLQKDFRSTEMTLTSPQGNRFTQPRQIRDQLTSHLGFSDQNLFEDTVFVRQAQIAQLKFLNRADGMSHFIPGLNRLIQAQKQVQSQLDELDNPHPNVKYQRLLQTKKIVLRDKEELYQQQQALVVRYAEQKQSYEDQADAEKELQARLNRFEGILKQSAEQREKEHARRDLAEDLDQITGLYNELKQIQQTRSTLTDRLTELSSYKFPTDFDVRADFLIGQMYRLEEETSVHAKIGGGSNQNLLEILLWVTAIIFAGTGIIFTQKIPFFIALFLIAIWVVLFLKRSAMLGAHQQKSSFEKDRSVVLEQLRDLIPIFADVDDDDPNYTKIRSQLEELQHLFRDYQKLKEQDNEARIRWEQTIRQIPKECGISPDDPHLLISLTNRIQQLEENIAELTADDRSPDTDHNTLSDDELAAQITTIRQQLPEVMNRRISLENELHTLMQDMSQWEDLEGVIVQLKQEVISIEHRVSALRKTALGLEEAIQKMAAFPRLNQLASNYLSQITGHQHQFCKIENINNTWQLLIDSASLQRSLAPHQHLSYGTSEQLYLAFRLALLESYPSPLFLDDILVHFDRKRQKHTLDLLNQLSKKRQVFLTTHDQAVVKMVEKVAHLIELK